MAPRPLNWAHAHRGYVAYLVLVGALLVGAFRLEDRVRVDERTCENRKERNLVFQRSLLAISAHIQRLEGDTPDLESIEALVRELPAVVC